MRAPIRALLLLALALALAASGGLASVCRLRAFDVRCEGRGARVTWSAEVSAPCSLAGVWFTLSRHACRGAACDGEGAWTVIADSLADTTFVDLPPAIGIVSSAYCYRLDIHCAAPCACLDARDVCSVMGPIGCLSCR